MEFNQDNKVVQLCAKGMEMEGKGQLTDAANFFSLAWNEAGTDFEKFTAAHYVARHQASVSDKLHWDNTALKHALNIDDPTVKATLPSLYLNIAKCYEDLKNLDQARNNYQTAFSFTNFLPDNDYGTMIRKGIANGLERTKERLP